MNDEKLANSKNPTLKNHTGHIQNDKMKGGHRGLKSLTETKNCKTNKNIVLDYEQDEKKKT